MRALRLTHVTPKYMHQVVAQWTDQYVSQGIDDPHRIAQLIEPRLHRPVTLLLTWSGRLIRADQTPARLHRLTGPGTSETPVDW